MSVTPTVIVVTHRGASVIGSLLDSLARQTAEHQTIVVDNGSTDGTAAVLDSHAEVDVVRSERNVGFSAAVNLAAGRAEGEALVLVNDDCVCDPGFVQEIAGALDPPAGVVMAAGVMRDARDERLIDTAGMELDATLLVFDYLNGEPVSILEQPGLADPVGPSGAAAAIDRSAFIESGGFDEALFAYWEDVDLVLRLRSIGGRCVLARRARGTHLHSATLGPGSAAKNRLVGFGRGYVLRKWGALTPTRLPAVLLRDGPICLGQIVIDRSAAGLSGRVRGWRAATPVSSFPGGALDRRLAPGLGRNLARRLRRRRRLRRAAPRGPGSGA